MAYSGEEENWSRNGATSFSTMEQWYMVAAAIVLCTIVGYLVYDKVMSTAADLLQSLIMISPLLLIIVVHWLSTPTQFSVPIPGSEPDAIHRAGGSAWGIALLLLLLFFLISYQPSLLGIL